MSNSFNDRLEIVLDGRKVTPWGKSLGLSNSVLGVMTQGTAPGPDHLKIIANAENVSINYLLTGDGCPFVVNPAPNSLNPDSEVFLLSFGGLRAVVTISDDEHTFERSGKTVVFSKVTIFRGMGFDPAIVPNARYFEFPAIAELLAGQLSKHALVGNQKDGLIYIARPTLEPWGVIHAEHIDQNIMRGVLQLVDELAEQNLTHEQKARIISSVYSHAIRRGLSVEKINKELLAPIVDAVR